LKDIYRDDEMAHTLFNEADLIEDESRLETKSQNDFFLTALGIIIFFL
jgi:hypothetical protein